MRLIRRPYPSLPAKALRLAARFRRAREGVAAVEFAAVLPLMLLMYLGTVEVGQAVAINRRVTLVSRTLSDLVAQSQTMNTTEMNNVFAATNAVLYPWPTSSAKLVVTSVKRIAANNNQVVWSKASGSGATPRGTGSAVTLPSGLLASNNDTVIMAEVTFAYSPIVGYFIKTGFDITETTYMTPRQVQEVPFS